MFVNNPHARFPCAVCGKSYLRKRHLQRHMRDECIGIPPRFSCDLCPSRFRRKYHMVRHLTSKHGIPPAVAQQTSNSGGGSGNGYRSGGESIIGCLGNTNDCDTSAPENLSLKRVHHHEQTDKSINSPEISWVNGGGEVNGAGTLSINKTKDDIKPTYGLTGAITAISTAAVIGENIEKISDTLNEGIVAHSFSGSANNEKVHVQNVEPIGEDWKMKLGIQLISNSLLKERLINTMPFAYNNN
ncbi:zinc finger protein 398-like [Eurosta solidaginis]|uniref:zinc finger protein 398-like n=1 Tax=Eurosta solidaginis TaxID=178769 RepID=UPI003530A6AF